MFERFSSVCASRLTTYSVAAVLAFVTAGGLSGCDDSEREIRELKSQVQNAYGSKDFAKGLQLSREGLKIARAAQGDDDADTLYFVQAISENAVALGNMRGAIAALKQEIDLRKAAGHDEKRLQPRRTLLIKIAEESGDKLTAADQAVEVSRGIDMERGKNPQPVYRAPTSYPPDLYRQRVEGDVEIAYGLDPSGAITDARVVNSTPARVFDQAALESFRKWRFTPMLDSAGRPISASGFHFTLAFRLSR